ISRGGPVRTPRRPAARNAVMVSAVAVNVLLGTQSYSTQAPPRPGCSTRGASLPSCEAARAAPVPAGPPPMIKIRVTGPFSRKPGSAWRIWPRCGPLGCRIDDHLRGVRVQHGSRPDAPALPAFAVGRHRVDQGLAADLRRGGPG